MSDPGVFPGTAYMVLFCVAGCGLLLLTRNHRADLPVQLRLFLVACVVRFALSVAIYQFGGIAIVKDEDASGWIHGADLHRRWQHQSISLLDLPFALTEAFDFHHRGYQYTLGAVFYLTDSPYRLVAAAFNCFCGALTVVFVYRIARTLFSEWVARRVGWWCCFFPSLMIWSAMTVKEPIIILLETVALYGCVRLRHAGVAPRYLLLCAVTVAVLIPFRFYAAYIVALAVGLALTAPGLFKLKQAVSGLALIAVIVPLLLTTGSFARHEAEFDRFSLDRVQRFRTDTASGGYELGAGSGVRTVDIRTPGGLAQGVALGWAHLLLAPFPWQMGGASLRMLLTLPELVVWWWLFFTGVVPGVRYVLRHRFGDVLVLMLFILGFGLLYAMMFGNVGLVFRQRAQLLPWLLILAAVGIEQRRLRSWKSLASRRWKREAAPSEAPEVVPEPVGVPVGRRLGRAAEERV